MFDVNLATSPSSITQLYQAYYDYWQAYSVQYQAPGYMIEELYELYYYTSTVNDNLVIIKYYYKYKDVAQGLDTGYDANYMSYDTTTGLYTTIDYPAYVGSTPVTSTSNGISAEELAELTLYYPVPNSNICFPAGTPITTNQGIIPIEKINSNVHTIRNKNIVGITKTVMDSNNFLVCFEKGSLGNNIPSQRTVMTQKHKVFYNGKMREAIDFVGLNDQIKKIKYNGELLYNVLMEDYEKMVVNDMICETLHPNSEIAKLCNACQNVSERTKREVIRLYNNEYKKRQSVSRK